MNPGRLSYRQLAKEAGVSFKTLYRVLNNEPSVRPATRDRVIRTLNLNGCSDGRLPKNKDIVIASGKNLYFKYWAEKFIHQLSDYPNPLHLEDYAKDYAKFLLAVENAMAVVIFGPITETLYTELRRKNPDAQVINVSGGRGDVIIGVNYFDQGVMAAEYLHQMGHRDICILTALELDRESRIFREAALCRIYGCAAILQYKYGSQNIERVYLNNLEQFLEKRRRALPTAFYAPNTYIARVTIRKISKLGLRYPEDYSILSTGLDTDSPFQSHEYDFDCIYHKPAALADLAEHFLIKRILTGSIKHLTIQVDNYLHIAGTVKNRNENTKLKQGV